MFQFDKMFRFPNPDMFKQSREGLDDVRNYIAAFRTLNEVSHRVYPRIGEIQIKIGEIHIKVGEVYIEAGEICGELDDAYKAIDTILGLMDKIYDNPMTKYTMDILEQVTGHNILVEGYMEQMGKLSDFMGYKKPNKKD
ncbi:MAG: hypothetical protein V1870_00645 [Candidatus Aenigmatarchaeota archaeon]